ncbi:hypothetical protein BDQ12DRAFT_673252 [Crucibulum laeve]|uniref:Uncharacterized protein n=1 Tax=Crucibulum laeve TaxID=68775 RepID=A0A5C3MGV1_9AGAR|nr:hypothetical protein BDQ12DRAFT_673252 [Crucibulum laeve]
MRLYQLALSAEAAATSLACSSILLGQTNESDDFGDVAVWLGEGDFRHSNAPNILQKLSLDSGLQINQIRTVPLSFRGTLPSTLSSGTSSPQLDSLVDQLMILTDKYSFRIPLATDPSRVVVFLLGKFGNEWGGLVGLGNWFD